MFIIIKGSQILFINFSKVLNKCFKCFNPQLMRLRLLTIQFGENRMKKRKVYLFKNMPPKERSEYLDTLLQNLSKSMYSTNPNLTINSIPRTISQLLKHSNKLILSHLIIPLSQSSHLIS